MFLRLGLLLRGKAAVTKVRNSYIADAMQEWGPDELGRRAIEKMEIERRRQIRENQLAQEKALTAVRELQKHFKNWQGKVQLREAMAVQGVKRRDKVEYEILKKCFVINYEQGKHEYRIKKGPHIMCADPLCHKIFASDEAYIEHVEEMQRLHSEDPSKVCSVYRRIGACTYPSHLPSNLLCRVLTLACLSTIPLSSSLSFLL